MSSFSTRNKSDSPCSPGFETGSLAPHPLPSQAACVAAHNGKVWHIAGNPTDGFASGLGAAAPVWSYDPAANEWALVRVEVHFGHG